MLRGPNATGEQVAKIYCEGMKRVERAFYYMTHVAVPGINPNLQFACLLDLLVDRNRGNTHKGQWRQEAGSVLVTGTWIHMADIRRAFDPGYIGTLRVCEEQYDLGLGKIHASGETLRDATEYIHHLAQAKERALARKQIPAVQPLPVTAEAASRGWSVVPVKAAPQPFPSAPVLQVASHKAPPPDILPRAEGTSRDEGFRKAKYLYQRGTVPIREDENSVTHSIIELPEHLSQRATPAEIRDDDDESFNSRPEMNRDRAVEE